MVRKKEISKLGKCVLVVILTLSLLGAAAVAALLATRLRVPERSEICGIDTSDMLFRDAEMLLDEKISTYSMHVTVGDQVFDIAAEDLGLVFLKEEFESVVRTMADTGAGADPWSVIYVDHDKLTAYLTENFDQKRTEYVPATVVWDDAGQYFKVIPGSAETWYDIELLADRVIESVASLTTELEIPEQLLYKEVDDTEQLAAAEMLAQRANDLMKLELEYVFNPRKVELGRHVIDGSMIGSFLRIDLENDTVFVDEDAVLTYVENIASAYSYFKHKDRFVTHDGDRIDVKIPFQNQVVDTKALTSLIANNILSGSSGTFEVPYSGAVNFEGSYIEVSIPQQHLWVYIDGVMVLESDVVTGNESIGKLTPTGLNYVRGHLRDIELFGDYFVNYWMAITRGGRYGFHDADGWRAPEEYGGDTYKSHGSGGCVNMPREKIAIMYDLVPDGTPVVIYNSYFYD